MSYKINELAKHFNVKGVGPKWAEHYIAREKPEFFLDVLKEWYPDSKPYVSLAEVAELAFIEGYGIIQARQDLNCYNNFEEYFTTSRKINPLLLEYKDVLLQCEKYFTIKPGLSKQTINVMATGTFKGYSRREDYFEYLNQAYGMYLQIVLVGKRKTNVSYLIMESDSDHSEKYRIAMEQHIPILTPTEFFHLLEYKFPYVSEESNNISGEEVKPNEDI